MSQLSSSGKRDDQQEVSRVGTPEGADRNPSTRLQTRL